MRRRRRIKRMKNEEEGEGVRGGRGGGLDKKRINDHLYLLIFMGIIWAEYGSRRLLNPPTDTHTHARTSCCKYAHSWGTYSDNI